MSDPVEEQKFYGQIRVMSVGGEELEWSPQFVNEDAEETKKIRNTLQTYVRSQVIVMVQLANKF